MREPPAPSRPQRSLTVALLLGVGLWACEGTIATPGGAVPGEPVEPGKASPTTVPLNVPAAPTVRLLTQEELQNSLRDVFQVEVMLGELPLGTVPKTIFSSPNSTAMSFTDLTRWLSLSADVARQVVARRQTASRCAELAAAVAPCVRQLVLEEGRRAFRRPLEPDELDAYLDAYTQERAKRGHLEGMGFAMAALLASPHFLYRSELGGARDADGNQTLSDFELATAMAFLVTRSAPDDVLLDAAASGALQTPEGRRAQLERLFAGPRGQEGLVEFYQLWLGGETFAGAVKDPVLFPQFTPALKASMRAELADTLRREVLRPGGSFKNLLTTTRALVDAPLAQLYSVPAPGSPMVVELPDEQRRGVFTRAMFISANTKVNDTHPIHMGFTLITRVLCQSFPGAPAGALNQPFTPDPSKTKRENFDARTSGSCAGCHQVLNDISFPFDAYDTIGRYRTELDGKPIDMTGELKGTQDANGVFANVSGLMTLLGQSRQVSECHVRTWLNYVLGRGVLPGDAQSIATTLDTFSQSGFDEVSLLSALVDSDVFRKRRPGDGG